MEFSDIVHTVFGRIGTAGTVVIDPDAVVVASARTWTTSGAGGYGQFVAGVPVADRHGVYQSLLPQLTDDQRYRTNFGLVNLGYDQLHAWVAPVVFDGEDPKPRMERIPAWGCADFSGRLAEPGDPVSDALILVEIEFLPGPHFAWASVVDNATGDAIFIPPVAPAGETLVIPAAAHAPGVGGAQWRTDLEVVGDPFLPVEYRLEWWPAAGGGAVSSVELSLSPGEAHRHEDVVATVLERHGAGAIAVVFTQGEALVSSRTFVQAPGGTYGQYVPRMPEAEALAPGVNGWLTPLRGGAEFRSNIGLVNPDDDQVSVTVSILDTAGAVVAEFTRRGARTSSATGQRCPGGTDRGRACGRTGSGGGGACLRLGLGGGQRQRRSDLHSSRGASSQRSMSQVTAVVRITAHRTSDRKWAPATMRAQPMADVSASEATRHARAIRGRFWRNTKA
jgi:hypothetical protein